MRTSTIHSVHLADCYSATWDEDDLVARLCGSLDQAEADLRELDQEAGEMSLGDRDEAERLTIKRMNQVAVLLLVASQVEDYAAIGPRVLRVASRLVPHAHSVRVLRRICLEPAEAFEYATAHICLKRMGYYECDFDAMLDLAAASQATDGRGRSPVAMIEQEWLKQSWLYPEGMRRLRCGPHVANSALARPIDLLRGSAAAVHSFTQALMHMTDFNIFPRTLPRSREALLLEAEAMLARCLHVEDYDLAAKILLAWPLTGRVWSAPAAFAFRVITRAADRRQSNPEDNSRYALGMLCAVSLGDRRMPPAYIPQTVFRAGALDAILDATAFDAHSAPWQEELTNLDRKEQDSLSEFLLSIALHREFDRADFQAIQQLLELGNALGMAGNPLAIQAAEMMQRLALYNDSLAASEAYGQGAATLSEKSAQAERVPACA